jgi:hypothetical protein
MAAVECAGKISTRNTSNFSDPNYAKRRRRKNSGLPKI